MGTVSSTHLSSSLNFTFPVVVVYTVYATHLSIWSKWTKLHGGQQPGVPCVPTRGLMM